MKIFMWSGPRNISTALMRSFENRSDTYVWDEPFYAYYLSKTNINHPLKKEIIEKYDTNEKVIIKKILEKTPQNKNIFYQKHMTHHILKETNIDWIKQGINCFLLRKPSKVISSYIKKQKLFNSDEIGFPNQLKIFNMIQSTKNKIVVINADNLLQFPKKTLVKLCNLIEIPYSDKMIKWKKGPRDTDGIWSKIWYNSVINSRSFQKNIKKNNIIIPKEYKKILDECNEIYNYINKFKI